MRLELARHEWARIPPGEGPSDTPGQMVPTSGGS
jgi:hypothetical protein